MTKAELISNIALKTDYSKSTCEAIFDTFVDELKQCLINGEKVAIKGFANFEVVHRAERKGRNPKTNEVVTFPATKAIKCQLSKIIKDAVNGK